MTSPAPVQDQTPKPPGLLPRNVQSWLLAGLAVLMVAIMWLTGGKKPAAPARVLPPSPPVEAPLEVNEAKIVELQNRIQELQREQAVAQNALTQQSHILAAGAQDPQTASSPGTSANSAPERAEDSIQAERKKRAYLSLFAPNVALSYRKSPQTTPAHEDEPSPAAARTSAPAPATGKTYVLLEGTVLETVLINRLDGQFSGPIECLLSNDVYSHDRQHLLIPPGSKFLGETRKVESLGQSRLAVSFHRLIMPDGYSVSLDHFQGLNQTGDAGLRDQVNNHYLRIFGTSLAIGAIGAAAEGGTSGALTASGGDLLRQGFAQSTAQSSAQILDRFLNLLPTITIREGHRVKVYLSGDLALPSYADHAIPSNL